ncbi:MAG: ABC transporter ATP-binding protein [Planctomycetota bacterium]
MTALHVESARKRFGDREALAGVDLEVAEGEFLMLLGPNGAGKTTLVRAVTGRVRLDAGRVCVFGRDLGPRDTREGLGLVPQEIALYGDLTPRENLRAFGRFLGLDEARIRTRTEELLGWINLADRADEPARGFSGGMKRRLNIACGVIHAPKLVLLDEPTVGVDPQSRERIYDMLDELRADGTAIVMTTHQLEEIESRCDRIAIIDEGRRVAAGTLGDLLAEAGLRDREVTFSLARPLAEAPAEFRVEEGGRRLVARCERVVEALPVLSSELDRLGAEVTDLAVRAPGLHDLFLELTGKELRE